MTTNTKKVTVSDMTGAGIQKAIDDISRTGGIVNLLPGKYTLSEPLRIYSNGIRLIGQGKTATFLKTDMANLQGILVHEPGTTLRNIEISHLSIQPPVNYCRPKKPGEIPDPEGRDKTCKCDKENPMANDIFDTTAIGVELKDTTYAVLRDLQVHDFMKGVRLVDATNTSLTNVVCSNTFNVTEELIDSDWRFIGFELYATAWDKGCKSTKFFKCDVPREVIGRKNRERDVQSKSIGFHIYGEATNDIELSYIETSGCDIAVALSMGDTEAPGHSASYDIKIDSGRFDRFSSQGVHIHGGGDGTTVSITDCWFSPASGLTNLPAKELSACVYVYNSQGISIRDCTFQTIGNNFPFSKGVRIEHSHAIDVVHSNFWSQNVGIECYDCRLSNFESNNFQSHSGFERTVDVSLRSCSFIKVAGGRMVGNCLTGVRVDRPHTPQPSKKIFVKEEDILFAISGTPIEGMVDGKELDDSDNTVV